jgi:ATP-dependent Zn protease
VDKKEILTKIAEALLEKENLEKADFDAIVGETPAKIL